MNMTGIIIAIIIVGGVGLLIGLLLGFASLKLAVEVDEREQAVLEALPGNNCGGCGFPGCSGLAAAIAKGEAPVNGCPVGGEAVANIISGIMGVEATAGEKQVAYVMCSGTCDKTTVDYDYVGVKDCAMLGFVPNGGPKSCNHGCLGMGNCVKACPFDAIHIVDGIALVDKEKCKACGKCIVACPKGLIELVPYSQKHLVACHSPEKGPIVMKACKTGCIGCTLCAKNCPQEAITMNGALAHIDYEKCVDCGICAEKCPKKVILTNH